MSILKRFGDTTGSAQVTHLFSISVDESPLPCGSLNYYQYPHSWPICFLSQLMRLPLPCVSLIILSWPSVFHLSWRESHYPVGASSLVTSQLTLCFPSQLTRVPLPCGSLIIGTLTVDPLFPSQLTRVPLPCGSLIIGTLTVDPLFSISVDESPLPCGSLIIGTLTVDPLFSISVDEVLTTPLGALLFVTSQLTLCFPSQLTRVPLPCGSLIIGTLSVDPLFSISVNDVPTTPLGALLLVPSQLTLCFPSQLKRVPLPCGSLIIGTLTVDPLFSISVEEGPTTARETYYWYPHSWPSVFHLSWRESHYPVGALLLVPSQLTLCFPSQLTRVPLPCGTQLTLCFPSQLTREPYYWYPLSWPSVFYLSWRESHYPVGALLLVPSQFSPLFSISVDESPTTLWEPYYWYRLKENYNRPIPSITSAQSMHNLFPNNSIIGIVRDPVER